MGLFSRNRTSAARRLVRERERLATLEPGGSPARPIAVPSASVVEVRARGLTCPQCAGEYRVEDHRAPASGLREVSVTCRRCCVSRRLWFRLGSNDPN